MAIKEKLNQREMPPWFIDKNVGLRQFKDDPSLQFEDADRWHIGKPDLVVSMPVDFAVKPAGLDWVGRVRDGFAFSLAERDPLQHPG